VLQQFETVFVVSFSLAVENCCNIDYQMATIIGKRPASSPASKEDKKLKDQCLVCQEPATDDVFECVWCEGRQHSQCIKISSEQCNVLSNIVTNVVFFCSTCIKQLPHALQSYDYHGYVDSRLECIENQLSEVQSTSNKLSELVNKVESQLCDNRKSLESLINDQSSDKSEPQLKPASISEDSVTQIAYSLASEQKEKEKRQLNIIIHNLEESNAPEGATRKQDDIKKCVSLLQTHLQASVTITNAIRMGKTSNKPRLLRISLKSIEEKASILKNKAKLRSSTNPENVRNIYITPDLTPLEQRKNKVLRQQLADLNKNERVYMIKNGRIVRRTK